MSCLSPFLKIGLIFAHFIKSGKIPDLRDMLHIWVRGFLIWCVQHFTKNSGISSNPAENFPFNLFIIFSISISVTGGANMLLGQVFISC